MRRKHSDWCCAPSRFLSLFHQVGGGEEEELAEAFSNIEFLSLFHQVGGGENADAPETKSIAGFYPFFIRSVVVSSTPNV